MIYLDLLILLNFLVDLLLILGTNRLAGYPLGLLRGSLAALLGGIYGGVCILPGMGFLGNDLWRMVVLAGMSAMAFGWNKCALRRAVIFILLSMSLGGIALALNSGGQGILITSALGLFLICRFLAGAVSNRRKFTRVILRKDGKTMHLTALCDTGNALKDPITGERVLIVGADVAEQLLGLSSHELSAPLEAIMNRPGLRLIPYRSVGSNRGMLLAARMDSVIIGGERGGNLVAFAPQAFKSEGFEALTGGV